MSLDSTHPDYDKRKPQWVEMRDFYEGEDQVKSKREEYLPATKGMKLDGMGVTANKPQIGLETYNSYLKRAVFPDYVTEGVEFYVGLLHEKPATVELPSVMEPLRERATKFGESLQNLLRRVNEEQLITGRIGLLLDLPTNPDPKNPMPYIALYIAEAIRNWDDGENDNIDEVNSLNLVVLDESGFQRTPGLEWEAVTRYRVLQMGDLDLNEAEGTATYKQGLFSASAGVPDMDPTRMITPMIRGNALKRIPFVFINTKDIVPNPDRPPLMGLGKKCLTIYRGEADYRQNLFMQGQDTLLIAGDMKNVEEKDPSVLAQSDTPIRTGAGSVIHVEQGGTAEYIGVSGDGLAEQGKALENDKRDAENKAGRLLDNSSGNAESGDALQTRVAAQTATLKSIARTSATGLQMLLRICAEWMGANPEEVKVIPHLDFSEADLAGRDLVDLMTARSLGAPLSLKSIHALQVKRGITEMTYEDETNELETEDAELISRGVLPDPELERKQAEFAMKPQPAPKTPSK